MSQVNQLPAPLTPSNCCLAGYGYMPLEVDRLRKSRAWLVAKRQPHLAFYMVNLWTAAWKETPAASLENDDDVLADAAMCDPEKWPDLREQVLRGFRLCSDGRLYHELIACRALEAWLDKLGARISSGAGNAARHKTAFDDSSLREQILLVAKMLYALDPDSRYFTKKPGILTAILGEQKPKKAPRPRKSPAANSPVGAGSQCAPDGMQAGPAEEPGGVAIKSNSIQSNDVGGVPPTTPGADAPGVPDGMPPAPAPAPAPAASGKIVMADKALALPEWLVPHAEAWAAFEEVRWKKNAKAPYTLRAQQGIVRKLKQLADEGQDLTAVLNASATNGWTDVYAQRGAGRPVVAGGSRFTSAGAAVFGSSLQRQEVHDA